VKILWHSNAPAPMSNTGYGNQTALFAPRLRAAGHDIAISCMTGMSGFPSEWDGIPLLPAGLGMYSSDILEPHARRHFGREPGLVLVHYDAWAIGPEAVMGLATAGWSPVHSAPMSQGDRMFYRLSGAHPISFSRHGAAMMRAAGFAPSYVPHGVDTSVFAPMEPADREAARAQLGIDPDTFVISVVAANKGTDPPRKGWGENFAAFAAFRERHPKAKAVMLVHSLPATPDGFGLDMRPLISHYGLGGVVKFSDDYGQVAGLFSDAYVARLLGCSDVHCLPSWGEGFGLPSLQAQACGVPVIVGDNSAQTELCGAGWKAACQPYWHYRDQANWHAPLITSVTDAIGKAYRASRDADRTAKLSHRAREFAQSYDADLVMKRDWLPVLEMLEQLAGARQVKLPKWSVPPSAATPEGPGRDGVQAGVPLPVAYSDGLAWLARGAHTDDWISVGHEDALAPLLDQLMPEGGVLLDVGAHVGRWSLRLAEKAARVIAVEANPATAAVLRYHIALNDVRNVEVLELAAWDEHTQLTLADSNRKVTGGSTRAMPLLDGPGADLPLTEAMPLDFVLEDEDRIDLIKLDVEGADLHALAGMAGTLERLAPTLFIEDHSIYGYYDRDELLDLLGKIGYRTELVMANLAGDRKAPYVIGFPAGISAEHGGPALVPRVTAPGGDGG
jgi:FkbM family methyltransferase